ncbi:MAG: aspartyl protease family protein, partial [Chloroflexota bacterium]
MPSILLRSPITFEVPGRAVHAPMVHASVNGVATKLILDTGCTDHILTMELAARANLSVEPGEEGTDAAGASVESWSVGSLSVTIGDLIVPLDNVVAFHGPEPFEGWGIGGFLSPQHLHPTANVILDLAGDELAIIDGEPVDVGAELIGQHPELRPLWLGREPGDTTVQIRAAIEPFAPVVTMLDSGGKATEFADSAVPDLGTDIREAGGRGVSGTQVHGSVVTDQFLHVGDATLPLPRLFVRPSSSAAAPGLVGMDLLRGTVLMVGA